MNLTVFRFTVAVSGTLLIASSPALARGDKPSFREFRLQNSELDRRAAREIFRAEYGRANANSSAISTTPTSGSTFTVPSIDSTRSTRQTRHLERRLEQGTLKQSVQLNSDNQLATVRSGVALDLGSSSSTIVLGANLFKDIDSVTISIGGDTKTVQAGSHVTAAEYLAVKQVLAGGDQTLILGALGNAVGGSVDFVSITGSGDVMRASDFVVPIGVVAYGDFSKSSDFRLLGDLTNFGTIYTLSSSSKSTSGTIRADGIVNESSGIISSVVDLSLIADDQLVNLGSITSTGSLSLSAGSTFENSGSIKADQGISINSSTVNNNGIISTSSGSISFNTPASLELHIDNTSGTIEALLGSINVRDSAYQGSGITTVYGGDLLSKEVNLFSGQGSVEIDVDALTGVLNQSGEAAHVSVSTDVLTLGNICLTGDPTYKNSSGSIYISDDIKVGEALSIISAGDITSADKIKIEARSKAGGFDILMLAGADQVGTAGDASDVPLDSSAGTIVTGVSSVTGGSVMLGTNVTINTRTAGSGKNGGDVFIGAYEGSTSGSGRVDLSGTSITTGGKGKGGINGDVTIVGSATNTVSIVTGEIDTTGGSILTGAINVITALPVSSNGANVIFEDNGSISSGNSIVAGSVLSSPSSIQLSGDMKTNMEIVLTASGSITQQSGSDLLVKSAGGVLTITAGQNVTSPLSRSSMFAETINLTSLGGTIGSSATALQVDADVLNITTPSGSAYVQDQNEVELASASVSNALNVIGSEGLTVTGLVQSTDLLLKTVEGPLVIDGSLNVSNTLAIQTLDGSVEIAADITSSAGVVDVGVSGGNLTINPGVSVTASDAINIINYGESSKDKIVIGDHVTISTTAKTAGLGDILISRGEPEAPGSADAPRNVTVVETGGSVSFAGKRIKADDPVNTITAIGADVLISANRSNSIVLGGIVNITADPPVAAGTPTLSYTTALSTEAGLQTKVPAAVSTPADEGSASSVSAQGLVTLIPETVLNVNLLTLNSDLQTERGSKQVSSRTDDSYILRSDLPLPTTVISAIKIDENGANQIVYLEESTDSLPNGCFLVVATTPVELSTSSARVRIAPQSVVAIITNETTTSVFDLHDAKPNSVRVDHSGASYVLSPGRHLTLTSAKTSQFSEINPSEIITHRRMTSSQEEGTLQVFLSEFSLLSAIDALPPLKQLIASKNAQTQNVAKRLIKTVAVVMHLAGQGQTSYHAHVRARAVAVR